MALTTQAAHGICLWRRLEFLQSMTFQSEPKDHERSNIPGRGANCKKIAHFAKLDNLSSIFQNGLDFLGRIGKASLSEFPEIYGEPKSTKNEGNSKNKI